MRRAFVVAAILGAGAMVSACGKHAAPPTPPPPQVTVATPLVEELVDWDDYVGRFEAVQTVQVRPRVSGYLVGVHFRDGQLVRAGQALFTIDARPFQASLDLAKAQAARAEATLANARSELARETTLLATQAVSREEFETRQATARTAEADLAAAQASVRAQALNVGFTKVLAPISGRISDRRVDIGNAVVTDQTVLTTIVSVDPIHLTFDGSEGLYLKYQRQGGATKGGQAVRVRLQDEADYRWTGRLDFVDNALDAASGAIRGRAVIRNPDGFLTPGMFGHLQMQGSRPYRALLVPDSAIATEGAKRIVYKVGRDGAVVAAPVTLGPLSGALRVVRSGLAAQDQVIVDGQQRARPGQKVQAKLTRLTRSAAAPADLPTLSLPPAGAATPVGAAG